MESNSWSNRLSTSSSRRYHHHHNHQSRSDLFIGGGFDETDGDDDLNALFLCPFCAEDFDIVGLCCHIDEDHPIEAKNGIASDSGDVKLFCLDSESCETICADSMSEREVLLEEDPNTLHLQHGKLQKNVDTFNDDSAQQPKTLSKQEHGMFCGRAVCLAAKGKRGRKVLEETSASEVININDDTVARRRTRRRKD